MTNQDIDELIEELLDGALPGSLGPRAARLISVLRADLDAAVGYRLAKQDELPGEHED